MAKLKTWIVWEAEYPEDGVVRLKAKSAWAAKRLYREYVEEDGIELKAQLLKDDVILL